MMINEPTVKLAVNGGISFGSKLNAKQLQTIIKYLKDDEELELTTFQQLYLTVPEKQMEQIKAEFEEVGLSCYPVGNTVKSLRTCNFCKGADEEGMPVAIKLNELIAGQPVPFTLRPAYTGCPIGCGEPLVNDIGIMKVKEKFDLYIGGYTKGTKAQTGKLLFGKLDENTLYIYVNNLIRLYSDNGRKREQFYRFVNRYGFDTIKEEIAAIS
ncbi:nitrite reductase [Terribacillus sp. JSM ZJ617]|uniref:nitrite reductase n=1 Tax=Terribacillus sp. JSM ZJ617 TaxID=3342119 RepID=UPI0035A9A7A1